MGLVDVNSPLSFFITDSDENFNTWKNNNGDEIVENRKDGRCKIGISGTHDFRYANTFDKAIDCLRYIKYKDMEQ